MTRGRKPTPTRLKLLKGNPGRRKPNQREPRPTIETPPRPEFLTGLAAEQWDVLAPYLAGLRVLTAGDGPALAALCQSWARYIEAEQQVAELGPIIKSPNGYPILNPHLGIANRALKQAKELLVEFGLTPSSRTRVNTVDAHQDVDPFEAFLTTTKA